MLPYHGVTATFALSAIGALAAPHLYIRDSTDDYYQATIMYCQTATCKWWDEWVPRCGVNPSTACYAEMCEQANFNELAKCFYCLATTYAGDGGKSRAEARLEESAQSCSTKPTIPPFSPIPGDPCWTDNGRFGLYQPDCTDLSPATTGSTCYLKDGTKSTIGADGQCGGDTASPKAGDPCDLEDGTKGKLQSDLKTCKAETDTTNPGDKCTTDDGKAGTIQDDKTCKETTDLKPGDKCTTDDGKAGTIQDDKTCKETETSTHKPGDACEAWGVAGVYDNDGKTCVIGGDPCTTEDKKDGYRDAKDPLKCIVKPNEGEPCKTANGKDGKYDKDGNCVAETPIEVGSDCSTSDGKPGKIIEGGKCKPNDNTQVTDPKAGTVCWSGAEKGIVNTAGQCIITQRIGAPVDNSPEVGGAVPTPKTTGRPSTSTSTSSPASSGAPAIHPSLSVVLAFIGAVMVL